MKMEIHFIILVLNCSSLYEAEGSPEHFDTFFIRIGQRMRCCPKKGIGWGGPRRDLKITILCYYLSFVPFFANVEANMFVFLGQGIHFSRLWKNKTFRFLKTLVLRQIKPRGCFHGCARNLFNFWCFVNVEWKKDQSEVHSETLNTLHILV